VRDHEAVSEMMKEVVSEHGNLYGLVNNAAGNFLSASEDLSPGGFKAIVDIVLHGTFNCTHTFGNYLIDNQLEGHVLNIVTTYAQHTGSAFVLPSACGKSAVLTMTRSLAYEWGEYGIRLNAIAPGAFPTKGAWSRLVPDKLIDKYFLKRNPLKRYGKHEELAHLAIFMMSDMSSYMNGECVTLDGGESLSSGQFNVAMEIMSRKKLKKVFRAMKPGK